MQVITIREFGAPEVLVEAERPDPQPVAGELLIRVAASGVNRPDVLQRKGAAMRERNFQPGFRITLHDKDLRIVTDSARTSGVTVPLGAQVAQLVGALNRQGHGDLDHSALLKLVEELSGRKH